MGASHGRRRGLVATPHRPAKGSSSPGRRQWLTGKARTCWKNWALKRRRSRPVATPQRRNASWQGLKTFSGSSKSMDEFPTTVRTATFSSASTPFVWID
ncbi:hypothetical protein XFF6166_830004 [Xanthomonas citri pv. fuscans]|nr:hypothetical protein XFF6166_830004 [Xanthomonas citri pv. fuscans]